MQREDILDHALQVLETQGLANTSLEMVAERVAIPARELARYWPDREALLYDALRHHSQQIEAWQRALIHNEELSPAQKILYRYQTLGEYVSQRRYPGCLFIAACSFFPDASHPIHKLADEQKRTAREYTHELLTQMEVDDPSMVAEQLELVLEGCLSRLMVKRSHADIATARRLAEDILRLALCRKGGALA